jgi:hypothetical protein
MKKQCYQTGVAKCLNIHWYTKREIHFLLVVSIANRVGHKCCDKLHCNTDMAPKDSLVKNACRWRTIRDVVSRIQDECMWYRRIFLELLEMWNDFFAIISRKF